jgi:short-subunit dehydrogenase
MNILLTGAFGNVGMSTLTELLKQGHRVRCFDLKTRANVKKARKFKGQIEVVWGDLRRYEDVAAAIQGQEIVLHLAFIIPKMSATGVECEQCPDWAQEINVGGTRNLIAAMKAQSKPPRIVFASSLHVYGQTQDQPPPRTLSDPVDPIEHYAQHKITCEQMVKSSGLNWAILRFGAVLPLDLRMDPGMFDVPLNNRMEFVYTRDVGLALANAASSDKVWGKTWLIGGGPDSQFYFREIVEPLLEAMGVGMLPEEAFGTEQFCTDWLDTRESQQVLDYQKHSFPDYIEEMRSTLGFRQHLIRLLRPFVRAYLLSKSPHYRMARKARHEQKWQGKVALVTGASSGIGASTAKMLAEKGLKVALAARRKENLEEIATEIQKAGREVLVLVADLTDEHECARVVQDVRAVYGPIDVLINNAGLGWYGYGNEMPWSMAQQMIQINMTALVQLTLLVLPEMKARDSGTIINIGSISGSLPSPGAALYSATKSFVDTFSTALYRELSNTNVHVSVLRPGAVLTSFFDKSSSCTGAMPMPAERFGVGCDLVVKAIWALLKKPRRVAYVPRVLSLIPWIELYLGWLLDLIGYVLLKRQSANGPAK